MNEGEKALVRGNKNQSLRQLLYLGWFTNVEV